jgi:uncharacterized protein (DUF1499 family)
MIDKGLAGLTATLLIILGCSIKPPDNPGSKKGILYPCPDAPNCVSTQSSDSRHAMLPLPFNGTKDQSRNRITAIIRSMKGSKIIDSSDSYIYAQFRTRFLRFVDDVEFFFDDTANTAHFRSASRVGYYDFGLNRRRMI